MERGKAICLFVVCSYSPANISLVISTSLDRQSQYSKQSVQKYTAQNLIRVKDIILQVSLREGFVTLAYVAPLDRLMQPKVYCSKFDKG